MIYFLIAWLLATPGIWFKGQYHKKITEYTKWGYRYFWEKAKDNSTSFLYISLWWSLFFYFMGIAHVLST